MTIQTSTILMRTTSKRAVLGWKKLFDETAIWAWILPFSSAHNVWFVVILLISIRIRYAYDVRWAWHNIIIIVFSTIFHFFSLNNQQIWIFFLYLCLEQENVAGEFCLKKKGEGISAWITEGSKREKGEGSNIGSRCQTLNVLPIFALFSSFQRKMLSAE